MVDPTTLVLSGNDVREFWVSLNEAMGKLSPDLGARLRDVEGAYFRRFGVVGVFERMNNRSIAQILAEFLPVDATPIASGERDGIRYELYNPNRLEEK